MKRPSEYPIAYMRGEGLLSDSFLPREEAPPQVQLAVAIILFAVLAAVALYGAPAQDQKRQETRGGQEEAT